MLEYVIGGKMKQAGTVVAAYNMQIRYDKGV